MYFKILKSFEILEISKTFDVRSILHNSIEIHIYKTIQTDFKILISIIEVNINYTSLVIGRSYQFFINFTKFFKFRIKDDIEFVRISLQKTKKKFAIFFLFWCVCV